VYGVIQYLEHGASYGAEGRLWGMGALALYIEIRKSVATVAITPKSSAPYNFSLYSSVR